MSGLMRAVQVAKFGGPEVLQLVKNLPIPKVSSNQVLTRVAAAGVNPHDFLVRLGRFDVPLPTTLGSDYAGTVVEVGPDCRRFKPGDRVYVAMENHSGGYASFALSPESHTFHLPKSVTFGQGAAIGIPYFSAYRGLFFRAGARAGEVVFVHGAGGAVGSAAVQLAAARGCRVYGTGNNQEEMKEIRENGAIAAYNHTNDEYVDAFLSDVGGADVVVEVAVHANLPRDVKLCNRRGRITAELDEIGSYLNFGAQRGWLKPLLSHEIPLELAADAHSGQMLGKCVLLPWK